MASPFVDKVTITVRAGDGGNGAVTFHREKYVAAAAPAVAAVRAAGGHIFLAVEAGAAVTAVARLYEYSRFIYELHMVPFRFLST